ncbi:MAG TPA: penicillin acylase family protein [Fimbriimonadaceae bacterium]|nr:penicillin acylase family protein [Fimbriimonadaceae bacterium]
MTGLLVACLVFAQPQGGTLSRDVYGVPRIEAPDLSSAFRLAGRAVAEDRLWQMEMSRRISRGRLAEVQGPSGVASDREALLTGYTADELDAQVQALPAEVRDAWGAYADGVNEVIRARQTAKALPEGYARMGFEPEPWSTTDSAAIAVQMAQRFGGGGAGELRNYALALYLKTQPCKDKVFDVLDDFAWWNDPASIPTVSAEDDLVKTRPTIRKPSRGDTERQFASLPPSNVIELMPAVRLAEAESIRTAARAHNVLAKTGSYAIVVSPSRSKTGYPILLSGPQMGFGAPSPVHEMAILTPNYRVSGLNVPGVPGIIVGHTPHVGIALTSGVADVQDIFHSPLDGDRYRYGGEKLPFETVSRTLKVKGEADQTIVRRRTRFGPVLFESRQGKAVYSLRSAFAGRELEGFGLVFDIYRAKTAAEVDAAAGKIPVTFNLFYATTSGDIGYRYCGRVPIRADGIDPRFPTPGTPAGEWKGFIPADQMPHALNPKQGFFANWNNKPTGWWPNGDTPLWGRIFRNATLLEAIPEGKLAIDDLERAAWSIARRDDETDEQFFPMFQRALKGATLDPIGTDAGAILGAFDGWMVDGSAPASIYKECVRRLRRELFIPVTGNFVSDAIFDTVAQPTIMWYALEGRSKFKYLGTRTADEVLRAAFSKAVAGFRETRGADPGLWRFQAGGILVPDQPRIPYGNRGTFIQLVEMRPRPIGRSVNPPGVAESGPHAFDQVPLARAWLYKPMQGVEP